MTSTVTCLFNPSWQLNSLGQNSCQVYAQLQGQCNSTFVISGVDSTSPPYSPPNNPCGCNYVAYNLMGGCGWCQRGISANWWLTVNEWSSRCTQYSPNSVPVSVSLTDINFPSWAFAVPTWDRWSPAEAAFYTGSTSLSRGPAPSAPTTASSVEGSASSGTPSASQTRTTSDTRSSGTRALSTPTESATQSVVGTVIGVVSIAFIFLGLFSGCMGVMLLGLILHYMRQGRRRAMYRRTAEAYQTQKLGYGLQYDLYPPSAHPDTPRSSAPLIYAEHSPNWQTEHVYPPVNVTTENWYSPALSDRNTPRPVEHQEESDPPPFDAEYDAMREGSHTEMTSWVGHATGDVASVYGGISTQPSVSSATVYGPQAASGSAGKAGISNTGVPADGESAKAAYRRYAKEF